jgi:hypothetical protein
MSDLAAFPGTIIDIALSRQGSRHTHVPRVVRPAHRFSINVLQGEHDKESAAELLKQRYAWRGYETSPAPLDGLGPACFTLCATNSDGATLGTLTLRIDGAGGLNCEATYPEVIAAARFRGERLAEICSFAVHTTDLSAHVIGGLFHVAYVYADLRQVTTAYIEVNPRHVDFYVRALGFSIVGPQRPCHRVGAPAVLMALSAEHMGDQLRQLGGTGQGGMPSARRSIYPFCFSQADEAAIRQRVIAMEDSDEVVHQRVASGDL